MCVFSELENEKMFGELPLETASRLLEENDFQDVLSRLPEETFDLFTSKILLFLLQSYPRFAS